MLESLRGIASMPHGNIFSSISSRQDDMNPSLASAAILLLCISLPILIFIIAQRRSTPARPRGCRRLGLAPGQSNLHDEFDPKYSRGGSTEHADTDACRIKALFTYPIKSCAGVELGVADGVATGFAFDRQFCFAEYFTPGDGKTAPYWDARTLRNGHYSRLALLRPEIWVPDPAAVDYASQLSEVRSQGVLVLYYPRPRACAYKAFGARMVAYLSNFAASLRLIPGELSCHLPLTPSPENTSSSSSSSSSPSYPIIPVRIWKDTPTAFDYGAHLPASLRAFLAPPDTTSTSAATAAPARPLTLLRINPAHPRHIFRNAPSAPHLGFQPVTAFADAYPLHLLNLASVHDVNARCARDIPRLSVRRFRANIIIEGVGAFVEDGWRRVWIGKEQEQEQEQEGRDVHSGVEVHTVCRTLRCRLPNVDPDTGVRHASEPDRTLKSYRRVDPGDPTNACLGMQCVPAVQEYTVRVGDTLSVLETGEHFYIKLLKPGEKVEGV